MNIFKSSRWHNGFLIECMCTKFPTSILQHQWRWCKKAGKQPSTVKKLRWPSAAKHSCLLGFFQNWCWGFKLCIQHHPYENKCRRTLFIAANFTLCLPKPESTTVIRSISWRLQLNYKNLFQTCTWHWGAQLQQLKEGTLLFIIKKILHFVWKIREYICISLAYLHHHRPTLQKCKQFLIEKLGFQSQPDTLVYWQQLHSIYL